MGNEIFRVTIKHKIYEWCIDIVFRHIMRNFPKTTTRVPRIGERYVSIRHNDIIETYYNCVIIDPKKLEDYELLDDEEKTDLIFAINYKKLIYEGDDGDEIEVFGEDTTEDLGYQYFTTEDMPYLVFKQ